ncbi:hypothetical protein BDA99DRAFT_558698 [Phascolomyces articulosus]|uniref:RRM domain-containing protein n=1 Tax=Phascolomyces articulosus TaxID=60185 RepID=A0AAD5K2T1_9FUNG|nr:hypothetical protein BDA99DRAFT_558698 [Phascolomyces articulosus]
MNTDANTVRAEDTITTLVMKHVPRVIGGSHEKAFAYFRQYNAIDVRPMEGIAMRGTVFLDFANPIQAAEAYQRLQQLSQQSEDYKKVRVEYAKPDPKRSATREHTSSHIPPQQQQHLSSSPSSSTTAPLILPSHPPPSSINQGDPIAPHLGIHYPPNPDLRYRYPDPTPEILNNMMHAIASVPRLYVQTLHLMNKMNLPPPFGPVQNESIPTTVLSQKRKHNELVASDESELESDEEQKDKEIQKMETRSKILAAQEQKRATLLLQGKPSSRTGGGGGGMKKIMLGTKKK